MEEETVASIARLTWRRQNLAQFEIGQLSYVIAEGLKKAASKESKNGKEDDELISAVTELIEANQRRHKAEGSRKEDEAEVELFEMSKGIVLDRLIKELAIEERLDAMIDRLMKRLLFVRGLKSIRSSASTVSPSSAKRSPPV
jgi:hypothetical protein